MKLKLKLKDLKFNLSSPVKVIKDMSSLNENPLYIRENFYFNIVGIDTESGAEITININTKDASRFKKLIHPGKKLSLIFE